MRQVLHHDLRGIAASMTISRFGGCLVNVFVPLLLLEHGLRLWQICGFYAIYALCKLLLNFPATVLTSRKGARLGLTIGYTANALTLVLLAFYVSGRAPWALFTLPLLMAADHACTWGAQHLHISQVMDSRRTSRDLAFINSIGQLAAILAPIIGAFVAVAFGQVWLAGLAALCVFAAIIPVRSAGPLQPTVQQDRVRYDLHHAPLRDLIANYGFNIHAVVGNVVWPFYLAVVLPNFHSIGIITTTSGAVAFALLFAAGQRGDRGKNHNVLVESTALSSLSHLSRVLASTPLGFGFVSAFYTTAISYQNIAWTSLYYHHAREGGINYIMSMEIMCDIAYVSLWSILGVIAYYTGTHVFFNVAFGAAALLAWASLLVRQDNKRPSSSNPVTVAAKRD